MIMVYPVLFKGTLLMVLQQQNIRTLERSLPLKKIGLTIFLMITVIIVTACGNRATMSNVKKQVTVNLFNSSGKRIGMALLTQEAEGVKIKLQANQLPPGVHAFHIHETGACDTPDFKTAGGHYNPNNKEHGLKNPYGPHAGDMKNIMVKPDGTLNVEIINSMVTLQSGQPNSLLRAGGTSLMIHAQADDEISNPSGNAGNRIVCGSIR